MEELTLEDEAYLLQLYGLLILKCFTEDTVEQYFVLNDYLFIVVFKKLSKCTYRVDSILRLPYKFFIGE